MAICGDPPFVPPAVGRRRVHGRFGGSRTASPSGAGFAYLLVSQRPLTPRRT